MQDSTSLLFRTPRAIIYPFLSVIHSWPSQKYPVKKFMFNINNAYSFDKDNKHSNFNHIFVSFSDITPKIRGLDFPSEHQS